MKKSLSKFLCISVLLTTSFSLSLLSNSTEISFADAAKHRLDRLQDVFAIKNNFSNLHPVIENEVKRAFETCGITEPIIVLQNGNSTNSACYPLVDELYYPVKALVVGVEDHRGPAPLALIRHGIFHECGHIVVGDVDQNTKKNIPFILTNLGLNTYATAQVVKSLKGFPQIVRAVVGVGVGIIGVLVLGRLYNKTIGAYQTRQIERNADIFAAQKLISLQDYYTLAYEFLDLTYNCDEGKKNWRNEYWIFHDHPEYKERARIILDELKKANIDLNNIPIDPEVHSDKLKVQQEFSAQIKKYFPEFLIDL